METQHTPDAAMAVGNEKIALIYSPRHGSARRWKRICRYFSACGVTPDYLKAENTADTERLAAIMTRNGYHTIIVVGGDAALNYALNGIMNTPSPNGERPVLGVIPSGFANDFARYWGFLPGKDRQTVDNLLLRRTRRVDVGRCVTTTAKGVHTDYFLNCVNIGVAASIMGLRHLTNAVYGLRIFLHLFASFALIFKKMNYKLRFTIDGDTYERSAMTLCIGSAHGYGQTPSAVPYNGMVDVSLVSKPQTTQIFHGLWLLTTGRFLSHRGISVWRTRQIAFSALGNAPISFDGRFAYNHAEKLQTDILPEEIRFIIHP